MAASKTDFTLVLGVDEFHVQKLRLVLPTWLKHKPSLFERPLLVFYDRDMQLRDVDRVFSEYDIAPEYQVWPPEPVEYFGHENSKWFNPQRIKMLSGFVHVPAYRVTTGYWMKLDLDVVATGRDDWIDPDWFNGDSVIISHPWSYTKPPNQMEQLDLWVYKNQDKLGVLAKAFPLNLSPTPGANSLSHKRIISWCSFYNTNFTWLCSSFAKDTEGECKLPVPSQDGFVWYVAKRLGFGINRTNMKSLGWSHQSSVKNIKAEAEKAMNG